MPINFDVPISIPDAKGNAMADALRWKWGPKRTVTQPPDNGQPGIQEPNVVETVKTVPELKAELKQRTQAYLKKIYLEHQTFLAEQQMTVDGDIDIT